MIIQSLLLVVIWMTSSVHFKKESESVFDWFKSNNMIANPDKFQADIMSKRRENQTRLKLQNNY